MDSTTGGRGVVTDHSPHPTTFGVSLVVLTANIENGILQ